MNNENQKLIEENKNSIKIIRGQRGNYGWEIKILDEDENKIFERIKKINKSLEEEFVRTEI